MERFTKVRNIGKGNMGACALARNNDDGKCYVIKQVDLTRMSKKERQQSLNEARVLSSLRHPNVINYVDSFLAKKSDHLCIVMEFADGGDLSSRIKKNYGVNFRESQVLDWFIQLVLSLHYVHQRKILHRDVKTQNVFVTNDNVVKLGDFGIARTLSNTYDQAKTFVGTPYYLSPELILERPYDHRSDVWAIGVVLYELLTLKHPFNASDMKSLMKRILKVQYDPIPMMYSSEVRNIVSRLLMKDPAQRIELGDVLRLPVVQARILEWFRGDVVPAKYLDTLVNQKLLPSELLERAGVAPQPQDHQHLRQQMVRVREAAAAAAKDVSGTVEDGDSHTESEGGHTKASVTDPILPPLTPHRQTPSLSTSEEIRTAPLGEHLLPYPSGSAPASSPAPSPVDGCTDRAEAREGRRPMHVVGAGGDQRLGVHRPYKRPSGLVGVGSPVYNSRPHHSPPIPLGGGARPSPPLPARLSSLDNFYQQLNYYQQHRYIGPAVGRGPAEDHARHGAAAAPAGSPPPLPHVPVPMTVMNSRRVSRKRSGPVPQRVAAPAHVSPYLRQPANLPRSGAVPVVQAPPEGAGMPDIKVMLQRAAQERAQARLGGVL